MTQYVSSGCRSSLNQYRPIWLNGMKVFVILYLLWVLLLAHITEISARIGVSLIVDDASIPAINHQDLDNDFEDGNIAPWSDGSENGTRWIAVENNSSWTIENSRSQLQVQPPPPPNNGKYFIFLKHDLKIFGIGILSSPNFIAYPGDKITFLYWLDSSYRHFNNLQLFWSAQDQKEEIKLLELYPTSLTQSKWLMSTIRIPIYHATIGKIILYGFCDSQNGMGYSIAIDEIFLLRDISTSSTAQHDSTYASTALVLTDVTSFPSNLYNTSITTSNSPLISEKRESSLAITTVDPNTLCYGGTIDFSPCYCYFEEHGFTPFIECRNVTLMEVRDDLFSRSLRLDIPFLILYPLDGDSVPEYLFDHDGVQFINYFIINCEPSLLEASPLAFENDLSAEINAFSLVSCNFKNLTFLKGLANNEVGKLSELNFHDSSNINETLKTLPDGFVTKVLRIEGSNLRGLILEPNNPQIINLQELRVNDNVLINDKTIEVLLNWMLLTANKYSLIKFYIYNNGLKRIPTGLWRLSVTTYFRFDGNIIESGIVKKGELKFYDFTLIVKLSKCGIHTIEGGAFQGVYEITNVYLDANNLTRFESDVYLPILVQMITYEGNPEDRGFLEVDGNPFDCVDDPCHLTWLLRDNKETFLPFIWNAACANGTLFQDIQSDDPMFNGCP